MEKSVHCKDDYRYEAMMFMKIVSPQIMKYLAPSLKSKNYRTIRQNNYPRITTLPPPKIVIVIVIVDSGIVGAVKHQIGR